MEDAESIATEMEGLYQKKPAEYIEIPRQGWIVTETVQEHLINSSCFVISILGMKFPTQLFSGLFLRFSKYFMDSVIYQPRFNGMPQRFWPLRKLVQIWNVAWMLSQVVSWLIKFLFRDKFSKNPPAPTWSVNFYLPKVLRHPRHKNYSNGTCGTPLECQSCFWALGLADNFWGGIWERWTLLQIGVVMQQYYYCNIMKSQDAWPRKNTDGHQI